MIVATLIGISPVTFFHTFLEFLKFRDFCGPNLDRSGPYGATAGDLGSVNMEGFGASLDSMCLDSSVVTFT